MEFMTANKAREIQDKSIAETGIDYEIGYIDSLIENAAKKGLPCVNVYEDQNMKKVIDLSKVKRQKIEVHYSERGFLLTRGQYKDRFVVSWQI